MRIDELGMRALFTEAARFRSWLDVEAALAELTIIPAEMPDSSIHGMRIGLCFRRSKAALTFLRATAVRLKKEGCPRAWRVYRSSIASSLLA
jgi:adenylosuccinate lyase